MSNNLVLLNAESQTKITAILQHILWFVIYSIVNVVYNWKVINNNYKLFDSYALF